MIRVYLVPCQQLPSFRLAQPTFPDSMATPTLSRHQLPGTLGEILIDLRTGDRESQRPAVVVLPGFKGFKDFGPFPALGERLARAGFTALSLSVSGSGVDEVGEFTRLDRFAANTISAELADLAAVFAALDEGGLGVARPSAIGLVGHSRGGGVALLFADRTRRVQALVTWAGVSTFERWSVPEAAQWRRDGVTTVPNQRTGQQLPLGTELLDDVEHHREAFDLIAAAARIRVPWLLAHGTADETVPVEEGRALASASDGRATTLWLQGALHAFGGAHPFVGLTPHLARLFDATVAHFGRHLP
jgi:dienelactone hydrolase